jgi:outer membrane protein assembly factor BamB
MWRYEFEAPGPYGPSSPTVANGTIYVGGMGNRSAGVGGVIKAVNASNGSQVWARIASAQVRSSPTVAGGTVYVGAQDGNAYAFDAEDGSEVWRFETERGFLSSPTVVDGIVYIGSRWPGNELHALDAEDGSEYWSYQTEGIPYSATVVGDTSGSSIGSRVLHGTRGNNNDVRSGEMFVSGELGSIDIVGAAEGATGTDTGSSDGGEGDEEVVETVETEGEGSGIKSFLVILGIGAVIAVAAVAVSRRENEEEDGGD